MNDPRPAVVCFGEILWDFLPRGAFPGGAPLNVSYHLHQQGLHPLLVSAIGRDQPGDELLRRLNDWGLDLAGLARLPDQATGRVTAVLGPTGEARYDIAPAVAWDRIELGPEARRLAPRARALVFGSLAQRSPCNRSTLHQLLALLPPEALRVFDVNLRPPHDDLPFVLELAQSATLLKLNAAEAARLSGDQAGPGREEAHARLLSGRTGCPTVCVSAGERGAGLLHAGAWHWAAGRPVTVRDTVGAGDAFTAGLLAGLLLHRESPGVALARACRVGEFVASCDGATPPYDGVAARRCTAPASAPSPHV